MTGLSDNEDAAWRLLDLQLIPLGVRWSRSTVSSA
jgi:hypothetical protein